MSIFNRFVIEDISNQMKDMRKDILIIKKEISEISKLKGIDRFQETKLCSKLEWKSVKVDGLPKESGLYFIKIDRLTYHKRCPNNIPHIAFFRESYKHFWSVERNLMYYNHLMEPDNSNEEFYVVTDWCFAEDILGLERKEIIFANGKVCDIYYEDYME